MLATGHVNKVLISPHLTSPHLTSPHLTSPHLTSPHLTSPHLILSYLNLSHLILVISYSLSLGITKEGLPGVLGSKQGTMPFSFREQGDKIKIRLGTREQEHVLGNGKHQDRKNTFREHRNTRKILLGKREHGLPPPPFFSPSFFPEALTK